MRYWLAFDWLLLGLLCVVIALTAGRAYAQSVPTRMVCQPYAALMKRLTEQHGESQRAALITGTSNSHIAELWATDSGSWTFVFKPNSETGCIMAAGNSWSGLLEPAPAQKGEGI